MNMPHRLRTLSFFVAGNASDPCLRMVSLEGSAGRLCIICIDDQPSPIAATDCEKGTQAVVCRFCGAQESVTHARSRNYDRVLLLAAVQAGPPKGVHCVPSTSGVVHVSHQLFEILASDPGSSPLHFELARNEKYPDDHSTYRGVPRSQLTEQRMRK